MDGAHLKTVKAFDKTECPLCLRNYVFNAYLFSKHEKKDMIKNNSLHNFASRGNNKMMLKNNVNSQLLLFKS